MPFASAREGQPQRRAACPPCREYGGRYGRPGTCSCRRCAACRSHGSSSRSACASPLAEPPTDRHPVDTGLLRESGLGGVPVVDTGDGHLPQGNEGLALGDAGGGAFGGKLGDEVFRRLDHEPVGGGESGFAVVAVVLVGVLLLDLVGGAEEFVDLVVAESVVVAEPGEDFVALGDHLTFLMRSCRWRAGCGARWSGSQSRCAARP